MPKDLRHFLAALEEKVPGDIVTVDRLIDPKFEITAIVEKLQREGKFPAVLCNRVKDLYGNESPFRVITNTFATRQKLTVSLDLPADKWRMETSLEFARRANQRIKPKIISREEAPVKANIMVGDEVDLYKLPILTHHEMDGYPYLVDAVIAADPENGSYNSSHHRQMVRSKDELGIYMSPRHLWNYYIRAAKKGEALPIAHVIGHHPGFYLGTEALVGMETDEYEVIGGVLNEPLRLVPSEAYGDRLLVPADAEVIIEGEILPDFFDAEGPFGEFTGYYGPQRWVPVVKVKAITYRDNPIYLDIMPGRADHWLIGGIPKEGSIYELVREAIPTLKAIHFPPSGCCRFTAYMSMEKIENGEGITAALASIPYHDELKLVVVTDDDIDPFNETEVWWAVATRVQPDTNAQILHSVRGGTLDPSAVQHGVGSKLLIDATKPVDRAFAERINVPADVMAKIRLDEWIS